MSEILNYFENVLAFQRMQQENLISAFHSSLFSFKPIRLGRAIVTFLGLKGSKAVGNYK